MARLALLCMVVLALVAMTFASPFLGGKKGGNNNRQRSSGGHGMMSSGKKGGSGGSGGKKGGFDLSAIFGKNWILS